MSYKLSKIFIFAAGAVVGSAVTWKYVKTKYERIAQEEIDSVKETFSKKKEPVAEPIKEPTHVGYSVKPNLSEYAAKLTQHNYTNYSEPEQEDSLKEVIPKPYIISPSEFDTEEGYEAITLYYHTDDVLVDDMGEVIEDIEGSVGLDFADHYGEYEDDAVHIRNERLKTDYEILLHPEAYSDNAD